MWAIKIKIFVVTLVIGFAIFYGIKSFAASKLWSAPCPDIGPLYHETPYANIPIEHSGYDHGHSSDIVYSSYPGPPQESYHSPSSYGTSGYSSDSISPGYSHDSISPDLSHDAHSEVISADEHYRRVSKQKRSVTDEHKEWVEIGFLFLGVRSNDCRKRFICEMDFKTRRNPVSAMMFKFAS